MMDWKTKQTLATLAKLGLVVILIANAVVVLVTFVMMGVAINPPWLLNPDR